MSERRRLPDRRQHEIIDFEHNGFGYTAGIGRFPDGELAEVFLNLTNKGGTPLDSAGRDSAVLCSLALQHGTPAEVLRRAVTRNANGTASGPIGTLLDLLAGQP